MNQSNFFEFMSKYICLEELEAVGIISISVILGLIITSIMIKNGERYGKTLDSAIQKKKNGQTLTEKEKRIFEDFENYKNNF